MYITFYSRYVLRWKNQRLHYGFRRWLIVHLTWEDCERGEREEREKKDKEMLVFEERKKLVTSKFLKRWRRRSLLSAYSKWFVATVKIQALEERRKEGEREKKKRKEEQEENLRRAARIMLGRYHVKTLADRFRIWFVMTQLSLRKCSALRRVLARERTRIMRRSIRCWQERNVRLVYIAGCLSSLCASRLRLHLQHWRKRTSVRRWVRAVLSRVFGRSCRRRVSECWFLWRRASKINHQVERYLFRWKYRTTSVYWLRWIKRTQKSVGLRKRATSLLLRWEWRAQSKWVRGSFAIWRKENEEIKRVERVDRWCSCMMMKRTFRTWTSLVVLARERRRDKTWSMGQFLRTWWLRTRSRMMGQAMALWRRTTTMSRVAERHSVLFQRREIQRTCRIFFLHMKRRVQCARVWKRVYAAMARRREQERVAFIRCRTRRAIRLRMTLRNLLRRERRR